MESFSNKTTFTFNGKKTVRFPLHLRVPGWCESPVIRVNGADWSPNNRSIVVIDRAWGPGDKVELTFPMTMRFSYWYERSLGIERGPLVDAHGR